MPRGWYEAQPEYTLDKCIHHIFEAQAAQTPDALAVLDGKRQLTYAKLNACANQLARYLRSIGISPETPVGLCMDRSLEMAIGLLAIIKAGGCYVPLDPTDPPKRLALIVQSARAQALLTTRALMGRFPSLAREVPLSVCIDQTQQAIVRKSERNLGLSVQPGNLLYLLFTSGSTGTPKGVAMPRRMLRNLLSWQQRQMPASLGQRTLQFAPLGFDVATQEIFATLCFGGLLVLVSEAVRRNPQALWEFLDAHSLERLFLPFVALQQLAEAAQGKRPTGLREVITAGEQLQITPAIARFFKDGRCRLHNQYGPTETHVVTAYSLPADATNWPRLPPIGRPLSNVQAYLLDEQMRQVAVGEAGELHIGGLCLARGYHRQPGLTQRRFVPNPFGPGRLYKTGDLACCLPDGNIEFLGRLDHQVKIRGFRVELGEIEVSLRQHPYVQDAVALAREDSRSHKQLLAYVVPNRKALSGKAAASQMEHVAHWQRVWDAIYRQPSSGQDPALNLLGWKDSYSGRPLPRSHMREWADTAAQRILSWRPSRVLEIGCGTGMLLQRIAPRCSRYVGTEVSIEALNIVQRSLAQTNGSLSGIALIQKAAHDFRGFESGAFDTVILNSVVELFPSLDYLVKVVERALRTIAPGGLIFIGDVRSLPHMEAFHAWAQLRQAPAWLPIEQLRLRIARQLKKESRLYIDPAFFSALKQHLPRISHVQIQLRRGHCQNEMTRFRYDAALAVEAERKSQPQHPPLDWEQDELSLPAVRRLLTERRPQSLRINHIPNARLLKEARLLELLADGQGLKTAEDLRNALRQFDEKGVEPEALWGLPGAVSDLAESEKLPYAGYVSWSRGRFKDRMDVVYQRCSAPSLAGLPVIENTLEGPIRPWQDYANDPLRSQRSHELESQLRGYLAERLPDYMLPAKLILIDQLPLTPSGKVNRRVLPDPSNHRPELETALVAPQTEAERQIAQVWREALELDAVGIHDNFFDLGGNSLLLTHVLNRLAPLFGPEASVLSLIEHPTIHALARSLGRSPTQSEEAYEPAASRGRRQAQQASLRRLRDRRKRGRSPRRQKAL